MDDLQQKLAKKGWSKGDIKKTIGIISDAEKSKPKSIKLLDSIVYLSIFVIAIFGSLVVSITLIPLLLTLKSVYLYGIIIIIGVSFGFLFEILLRDASKLSKNGYVIGWVFIPALAIINVYFMTQFANFLISTMGLKNIYHNLFFAGFAYTLAFVFPYFYYRYIKRVY